jgi:hypothetical protein
MDLGKSLEIDNNNWELRRASLSKEEIAYIGDKDSFRGKIHDCFTIHYYKRGKLIQASTLVYGYVFKSWTNEDIATSYRYPTWVLFSPSKEVNDNPSILQKVAQNLLNMEVSKENHTLYELVHEPLSDTSYFEIPPSYSEGKLVYLSVIYLESHLNPDFKLGLNILLIAPSVSKEALYLPTKYYSSFFKEEYSKGIKL